MNALTFENIPISIIESDGLAWLPGPEIARAIGYEDASAVRQIFDRHEAEFSDQMSRKIKMTRRAGGGTITRVFSPRGALLLAMHANTPRAAAFRAFVLDILEGKRPLPGKADRASRLTEALLLARPRWARHLRYSGIGLTQAEIARLEGVSQALVSHDADNLRDLGLLHRPKHTARSAAMVARRAGHA
jgi:hypothetical protein